MANYANVENGIVKEVIVVDNSIENPQNFIVNQLGIQGTWIQTSYNTYGGKHLFGGTPINMNYAGIGYTWDGTGFAKPQPYPSWTLDKTTYLWNAPTPMPTDENNYRWDEETLSWLNINNK